LRHILGILRWRRPPFLEVWRAWGYRSGSRIEKGGLIDAKKNRFWDPSSVLAKCGQYGPSIAKTLPQGAQEASKIDQNGVQREAKWLPEASQNINNNTA